MSFRRPTDNGLQFPAVDIAFPDPMSAGGSRVQYVTSQLGIVPEAADAIAPSIGKIWAVPYFVVRRTTFTEIGANITTGGGKASRMILGLYSNLDGSFFPNARIFKTGSLSANNTGLSSAEPITSPLTISGGKVIWIAGVQTVGPASTFMVVGREGRDLNMGFSLYGGLNGSASEGYVGFMDDAGYADLPAQWPTKAGSGTMAAARRAPLFFLGVTF